MAATKRIFREWQHPRASNGRFARKGSPEWVKAAAEKFRNADTGLKAGTSAPGHPGRPRISRGAKAERAFAAHDASVTTGLGRQPVQGPARPKADAAIKAPRADAAANAADDADRARLGLGAAEKAGITGKMAWGELLAGPQKEQSGTWRSAQSAEDRKKDRLAVQAKTAAVLSGGAPKRANVFDNPEFANSTGKFAPRKPVPRSTKEWRVNHENAKQREAAMTALAGGEPTPAEREKARQERLMSGAGSAMAAAIKAPKVDTSRDKRESGGVPTTTAVTGVDMTDPNRWNGDKRYQFGQAARYEADGFGGGNLLDDKQKKGMRDAVDEFDRVPSWETQRLDVAARKIQVFRDENQALKDDFSASKNRLAAAAKAGGYADREELAKAEVKRLKKAHGIPGDAAVKKLPDGQRHLAESIIFDAKNVGRTRAAAANNRRSGELIREELARTDLHPRTRAETEKFLKSLDHMASDEGVVSQQASLQARLDVWDAVRKAAADGDAGPKGDYNFEVMSGGNLSREHADALMILGRQDGTALAERAAADLRGAPKSGMEGVSGRIAEQRGLPTGDAKLAKLSDAQVRNGLAMRGNQGPEGKALQAEADRRGLGKPDGVSAPPKADLITDAPRALRKGNLEDDKPSASEIETRYAKADAAIKARKAREAAERAPNAVGDASLGADATPAQIDVIKDISGSAKASLDAGTNPATAYHQNDRGTNLILARQAKISVRGKSNDEIAAALSAKDAENKAARAAKKAAALNPASTGDRTSSQHEVHTPEQPRRYQTFADRMAGDMSEADRRNARLAREEGIQRQRALDTERARQRAETEANDTRSEREKLTEQLQQQRDVDHIDRRSGRVDPKRTARIKAIEARLEEIGTEDRKAKIKTLGVQNGDKVKTALGEFEVTGKTGDGYLRVLRPDGRRGSVRPGDVEAVTKAPKAEAAPVAAPGPATAPTGRAARIEATLKALPDGFKPDEQTRQQYVVESKGTWHVGMEGHPYYLQDMKSKREALAWIVNAQASRERLRNDPINRADSTPYGKYGSLSRADFDKLPPARQREIAAELGAARRNPTGDGGASLLIGKFGLAPTPAQRQAGDVTAHPSAIRAAAGQPASGRITPAAKRGVLDTSRDKSHSGGAGKTLTTEANMSNPTPRQMPYTTGRRVEVQVQNFDKPGFPMEWMPGTVDEHRLDDNGRIDMRVKLDKGGFAGRQIIGKQGGNKNVRPIAPKSTVDPAAEARRMEADTARAAAERQRIDAEETARRNTPQATTAPVRTFEAKTDEQVIAEGQARRADVRAKVDAATSEREVRDAIHGLSKAQLLRLNNDMGGQGVQGSSEDTLRRSIVAMAVKPSAPAKKAAPGEPQLGVTESSKGRPTSGKPQSWDDVKPGDIILLHGSRFKVDTVHPARPVDTNVYRSEAGRKHAAESRPVSGTYVKNDGTPRAIRTRDQQVQTHLGSIEFTTPTVAPQKRAAATAPPVTRERTGTWAAPITYDEKGRTEFDKPFSDHLKTLTVAVGTGGEANALGFHMEPGRAAKVGDEVMVDTFSRLRRGIVTKVTNNGTGTARVAYVTPSGGYAQEANSPVGGLFHLTEPGKRPGENRAALLPKMAPEARPRPTAEEKAASAEVKKAAEAARNAADRQKFLDRVIGDVEKDIAEGKDATARLHYTDAGLRQLAKDVGAKIPRQPRTEYGTARPLDKDQARRLIVEAIRERLGKA